MRLEKVTNWAEEMGRRLQENNEDIVIAYEEVKRLEKQISQLKRGQYASPILFSISGLGAGMAFNELTKNDSFNSSKFGVYAGTSLLSFGVWAVGHWLVNWW